MIFEHLDWLRIEPGIYIARPNLHQNPPHTPALRSPPTSSPTPAPKFFAGPSQRPQEEVEGLQLGSWGGGDLHWVPGDSRGPSSVRGSPSRYSVALHRSVSSVVFWFKCHARAAGLCSGPVLWVSVLWLPVSSCTCRGTARETEDRQQQHEYLSGCPIAW